MGCCICTSLNIQSSRCFYKPLRKKRKRMLGVLTFSVSPRAHFTSCVESDEDFIEEMFSEVGMEQDHDGFHVV